MIWRCIVRQQHKATVLQAVELGVVTALAPLPVDAVGMEPGVDIRLPWRPLLLPAGPGGPTGEELSVIVAPAVAAGTMTRRQRHGFIEKPITSEQINSLSMSMG